MRDREIILVIRRTKEYWLNNSYRQTLNSWLIDIIDLWNQSFKMQIMDFRNRLRDIASSLYLKNKFDKIFLHSHKDTRFWGNITMEEIKLYKNTIFVPIDEDDWIRDCLSDELRNIDTEKTFFAWEWFATIRPEVRKSDRGTKTSFVQSCAWACVGIEPLLKRRNNLYLINNDYSNTYFIYKPLSTKVEHIGSAGLLRKTIKDMPNQRDKWIESLINRMILHIQMESDLSKIFSKEWELYKSLLKELLSSYKYLTSEQKVLL